MTRHTDPEMNRALEEDAAKIEAMGGDPGPTFEELFGDEQRALNDVWRAVDAIGGTYTPEEERSGYAAAHKRALDHAIAAVESLGGVWN